MEFQAKEAWAQEVSTTEASAWGSLGGAQPLQGHTRVQTSMREGRQRPRTIAEGCGTSSESGHPGLVGTSASGSPSP